MSPSPTTQPSEPSASELVEGLMFYPIALVVAGTIVPGMTLTVPALLFVIVLLLVPLVALAIVGLAVAAVVSAPFLLVRGVRALRARRAESGLLPRILRPVKIGG